MGQTEYIYHGRRFWVMEPKGTQHLGWNTEFIGCPVFKRTPKRVGILHPDMGVMWLNRAELERDGKVYHSRPHEYFYTVKPAVDPEKPRQEWSGRRIFEQIFGDSAALSTLGLEVGCSTAEIKQAYKRLAKAAHPDGGGSHEAFLKLNKAYLTALRTG